MRRCTAALPTCRSWQARRWTSYDRSVSTEDALRQQVEAGLGRDNHGEPLRIDTAAKTISTAAGTLPISPMFDPNWIRAKRRVTKAKPQSPTGRFRRKLIQNPFGESFLDGSSTIGSQRMVLELHKKKGRSCGLDKRSTVVLTGNLARALASPIRLCPLTRAVLPRQFLLDFEVVNHPETGEFWWAPGAQAVEKVKPKFRQAVTVEDEKKEIDSVVKTQRAPIIAYALNKKSVLDKLSESKKTSVRLLGARDGTAHSQGARLAFLRPDMSDVVLKMLRQEAVDALIARCTRTDIAAGSLNESVQVVSGWDEVKLVKRRGCILLLREHAGGVEDGAASLSEYATFDVDGAKYDSKMPVHDLDRLLGAEEVARLRAGAPAVFGKDAHQHQPHQEQKTVQLYVLKIWPKPSMVNLHQLLWRLQGYLAKGAAPSSAA